MNHSGASTNRLVRDGDSARVATKLGHVLMHPLKGKSLIEESGVRDTPLVDLIRGEPAECAEAVLNNNGDEAIAIGALQGYWIIGAVTRAVATTMDPD